MTSSSTKKTSETLEKLLTLAKEIELALFLGVDMSPNERELLYKKLKELTQSLG